MYFSLHGCCFKRSFLRDVYMSMLYEWILSRKVCCCCVSVIRGDSFPMYVYLYSCCIRSFLYDVCLIYICCMMRFSRNVCLCLLSFVWGDMSLLYVCCMSVACLLYEEIHSPCLTYLFYKGSGSQTFFKLVLCSILFCYKDYVYQRLLCAIKECCCVHI